MKAIPCIIIAAILIIVSLSPALGAETARGIKIVAKAVDTTTKEEKSVQVYDRSCALLIGIDNYNFTNTGFPPLKRAVSDTKIVRNALNDFIFTDVQVLINESATRKAILAAIEKQMREAGRNGAVFIYYAGHGHKIKGPFRDIGFLVPYDGSAKIDHTYDRNIPLDKIKELAEKNLVKHTYIALDCCFSGLLCYRSMPSYSVQAPDFHYLREITSKPVVQVITASGKKQQSIDGLFARQFVDALAHSQAHTFVTAQEIANYVVRNVVRIAREQHDFLQLPNYAKLFHSVGEYTFVRKGEIGIRSMGQKLVQGPTFRLPGLSNHASITPADIDDNGSLEFIVSQGKAIYIYDWDGKRLSETQCDRQVGINIIVDYNNDGQKEIFASGTLGDDLSVFVFDNTLKQHRKFSRPGRIYKGRPDSGIQALMAFDIDRDGKRELISKVGTGYGWSPRGISVFDFDSSNFLWHWETGPGVTDVAEHQDPTSAERLLCLGSYSPGNGYKESKGTDDMHSYIWLVSAQGRQLWRKQLGEYFTGSYPRFVDLDHDGIDEILVYMNTAYEYRPTDNGNVYLFDILGNMQQHYKNQWSVKGVCIVPSYETKSSNVLLSVRGGELILLDSNLHFRRKIKLPNESGKVAMPIIKGLMNTYFGEFVVLQYHEEDRIVKNPRGDYGPKNVTDYYNVKILLLDRKTLDICHEIKIANNVRELKLNKVQIFDIDANGQDDILAYYNDRIESYKIIEK